MAVDLTDTPHPNPEVEKDWQDFWLSYTFEEGFTLNDIKAELSDYHRYLTETAKVYVEITGGRISKQNTTADAVIGEYQAVLQETVDEAIEDAITDHKHNLEVVEQRYADLISGVTEAQASAKRERDSATDKHERELLHVAYSAYEAVLALAKMLEPIPNPRPTDR